MKIYLKNEKDEILREFTNVLSWGYNFVEYDNGGRCKIYCNENEYFTDKSEQVEENQAE